MNIFENWCLITITQKLQDNTTILYGGSCKPSNAQELFANPDVDGGLIGGASLKANDFIEIITQSGTCWTSHSLARLRNKLRNRGSNVVS